MFKKKILKFNGMYRGKVLSNTDPDMLGRLKVQVFGVFDDIIAADLPWAVPAYPLFSGSGSDYGFFTVPEVDSFVWIFFEMGDVYQPVYFAEAPTAIHGIPSEAKTDYPYRKVIKTKAGIIITIDNSTGGVTIDTTGASGDIILKGNSVSINP